MNSDLGNWLRSIGFSGNEGVCMICDFADNSTIGIILVSTGSHSNAATRHRLFVPDMEDDVMQMQNSEQCTC
jgi:hypothetical protein